MARAADGTAGARTTVASFAAGQDAVDVAVGSSRLYVALRGADAIAVLERSGAVATRITAPSLRAPTSVAVTVGKVLVASGGSRAALLQVAVADRPAS